MDHRIGNSKIRQIFNFNPRTNVLMALKLFGCHDILKSGELFAPGCSVGVCGKTVSWEDFMGI